MIYREYGQTGKKVSLLGFGGMRFANINDHDECIHTMVTAAEGGVNYFDTAPGYFETKSETVFGKGFAELRRRSLPYFSATKTFASEPDKIRREIEDSLKRLDVPAVDFYHIWCVGSLENWQERKNNGILDTFRKIKDEGLIRHICVSSHLINDEIKELLMEGVFEGVLFGYSAYNFKSRYAAFEAIREKKLGAVVMNPLGGGVIPQNEKWFGFLRRSGEHSSPGSTGESTVTAALRFLWDHPGITSTLVGFETAAQVKEALSAMEGYQPRTAAELEEVMSRAVASFEGICTGCGYCVSEGGQCPQGIPIPKYMEAYNHKILDGKDTLDSVTDRLRWHWNLVRTLAGKCTACGLCEKACTQHIGIIKRLQEIALPDTAS